MTAAQPAGMALARRCRAHGMRVPTAMVLDLGEALVVLGGSGDGDLSLTDLYWAGRATLTRHPDDLAPYERAFADLLVGTPPPGDHGSGAGIGGADDHAQLDAQAPGNEPVDVLVHGDEPEPRLDPETADEQAPADCREPIDEPGSDGDGTPALDVVSSDHLGPDDSPAESDRPGDGSGSPWARASALDVLRRADLADLSVAERAEVDRLIDTLRIGRATRRSRRREPSRRRGAPDLGRTLRRTLRAGPGPVTLAVTRPSLAPRSLVFLLDVSGSMEPYARSLLRFAHAGARSGGRVEVFALGTRCTRVTRELSSRDAQRAVDAAGAAIADWAGGTRLGENLRVFNDTWGVRGLARGATVVILSDGWERGDPGSLGDQMARLGRVAHRVVWVNPLKAGEGYEPLARGMAAALPHVDDFVTGHSFDALADLARLLADPARRVTDQRRWAS